MLDRLILSALVSSVSVVSTTWNPASSKRCSAAISRVSIRVKNIAAPGPASDSAITGSQLGSSFQTARPSCDDNHSSREIAGRDGAASALMQYGRAAADWN